MQYIRSNSWTEQEEQLFIKEYPTCEHPKQLAVKMGRSYKALLTRARRLNIQRIKKAKGRHSDTSFDQYIKDHYLTIPVKTIGSHIGKSYTFIAFRLQQLGLEIPKEIREQRKQIGQIRKGCEPPNKGRKWTEYMSKEAMNNCLATAFNKGNQPYNTKYDGAITIREDKRGVKYKFIRIAKAKWLPLHVYTWLQSGRQIPKNHIIIYKDSNTMNCTIENLDCISRKDNMKRNSYHNYGQEIAKTYQLRGVLSRQINKHLKKLKQ